MEKRVWSRHHFRGGATIACYRALLPALRKRLKIGRHSESYLVNDMSNKNLLFEKQNGKRIIEMRPVNRVIDLAV